MAEYPHLDELVGTYLHQDFDLFGDDLPEVVEVYRSDAGSEAAHATADDVARLRHAGAIEPGMTFTARYPNGVLPSGWSMSNAEWLAWLERLLRSDVGAAR